MGMEKERKPKKQRIWGGLACFVGLAGGNNAKIKVGARNEVFTLD